MPEDLSPVCPDCGHTAMLHHPALTREDGCIGAPGTPDMATLSAIRGGRHCRCANIPDDIPAP